VVERLKTDDLDVRFWATLLVAELPYADAAGPLVPRLFDDDGRVRRAARLAARSVAEVAPHPIIEALGKAAFSSSEPRERRVLAIEALGDMREPLTVPVLASVLDAAQADEAITEA